MENNFHRELLGEWIEDKEFELYVDSWMIYHKAADKIDGHIEVPRSREEYAVCHLAVSAGSYAQKSFLIKSGIDLKNKNKSKWNKAKLEALRRIERGI
jgi:hypothetical protein